MGLYQRYYGHQLAERKLKRPEVQLQMVFFLWEQSQAPHLAELEVAVYGRVPGALQPRRQRLHPAPDAWLAHLAGGALQVLHVLPKPQHRRLAQLAPQLLARALRLRRVAQGCVSRRWPAELLQLQTATISEWRVTLYLHCRAYCLGTWVCRHAALVRLARSAACACRHVKVPQHTSIVWHKLENILL